jgi:hypothetical protein
LNPKILRLLQSNSDLDNDIDFLQKNYPDLYLSNIEADSFICAANNAHQLETDDEDFYQAGKQLIG